MNALSTEIWTMRSEWDIAANALADRHYSRQTPGCGQVGPPGRRIVMVSRCDRALWLTHYPRPDFAQDGLDAYRCSIFRNEGAGLASGLIVEAMSITELRWGPAPDGWVTWVDTRKIDSENPGYCFKCAGWREDKAWRPARGRRGRLRFVADPITTGPQLQQLELQPTHDEVARDVVAVLSIDTPDHLERVPRTAVHPMPGIPPVLGRRERPEILARLRDQPVAVRPTHDRGGYR